MAPWFTYMNQLCISNESNVKKLLKLTEENEQNSLILWYLNMCQIERMKIRQKKFQSTKSMTDSLSE